MEVIKTLLRQALIMLVLFGAVRAKPAAPHFKAYSGSTVNPNGGVKGIGCLVDLTLSCSSSVGNIGFLKNDYLTELNGIIWTAQPTISTNRTIAFKDLDATIDGIWRCQAKDITGTGQLSDPSEDFVAVTCKTCGTPADCTDPRLQCLILKSGKTCTCRYGLVKSTAPFDGDASKCRKCDNAPNVHPNLGCTNDNPTASGPICDIAKNNGQGECIKSGNTNTGGSGSEIRPTWPVVVSAALMAVLFRAFCG